MKINREKVVVRTSIISIITNIVLSIFKAIIGVFSNSIAIISDSINNLSDAFSSIITIVGTKLASKSPDKEHPFGHGRIEYMTSMIVSIVVLYAGITAFIESMKKVINPEKPDYSTITLIILLVGIIVKFILGLYVKKKGREVNSDSLVASGFDAFNDAILSISVLISALIYILFNLNIESYVGVLLSIIIIKSGIELIRESVDNMIGVRVESAVSGKIKKEILKEEDVEGVFDLILNNYGPDKYMGSVHIEVLDTLTVSDIDKLSRRITKNVLNKFGVMLHTIGIYSVNTKDKEVVDIQKDIHNIVFSHDGIIQLHGFYLDYEDKSISFDIIMDFSVEDKEKLYKEIYDEVKSKYKDYKIIITLDIDISD